MNLSRRNKYLTVIAICGVALIVDRLFLPQPTPAESGLSMLSPATVASKSQEQRLPTAPLPVPEIPFPKNISTLTQGVAIRDIFTTKSQEDVKSSTNQRPHKSEKGSEETGLSATSFEAKHKLTGLMFDEHVNVAVLGALWVEIGQEIDGCKLEKLTINAAVFACFDGEASLALFAAR